MGLKHSILRRVRVVENSEFRVKVTVTIPNDLEHLQGHFPGSPVTPFIVLVEISSILICDNFYSKSMAYKALKKSRSTKMILPENEHSVLIEKSEKEENSFFVQWFDKEDELCARFTLSY